MKNSTPLYILCICISTFILSCRPESLQISLPEYQPQVVVFSQIIPNALMAVSLSKTIGALEFSEQQGDTLSQNILDALVVSNADVTVSYQDRVDTLNEIGAGIYVSAFTPAFINETYQLRVVTQDNKIITSQNTMLPIVVFDQATPSVERTDTDTLVKFNFRIIDEPGDNWYMINFYTNGQTNTQPDLEGIDINNYFESGSNFLKRTELISDAAFSENTIEATIQLPEISQRDSLTITLSNINETYFDYLQIRQTSSNLFTEITKEPVTLPSNIEGGLGFFNTHYPDIKTFDIRDF